MNNLLLEKYRVKVLVFLYSAGKLTRAQLIQGPLRHLNQTGRLVVLRSLTKDDLAIACKVKRSRGRPAIEYSMSDLGRKHCEQSLKDEIGGFHLQEVVVRKRQLQRPQPGNLGV